MTIDTNISIETAVKKILLEIAQSSALIEEVSEDTTLSSLGITSLLLAKIIVELEEHFGIEVDDVDLGFDMFKDVKSITSYVLNKLI